MWNAELYDRYGKERIQPSADLVNRIRNMQFKRILDVGCGTGMSTASLAAVWQDAEILGADLSEEMLQKAKAILPEVTFVKRDCSQPLFDMGTFDLIFSNAFLQWIPDQKKFIENSFRMLDDNGVFAAQIPLFNQMPAYYCITEAEKAAPDTCKGLIEQRFVIQTAAEYYDMMMRFAAHVSVWVTDYYHEMNNHKSILDFLNGTALRPYKERMNDKEWRVFAEALEEELHKAYPSQLNGKVLFPFKRLFLIGYKQNSETGNAEKK